MREWCRRLRKMGVVVALAWVALPLLADAQQGGVALKLGGYYAIGFPEGTGPILPPVLANSMQKTIPVYRVLASAGDQQWYRVRMMLRTPQGGWFTPAGATDTWVNLTYAMWVQEVMR